MNNNYSKDEIYLIEQTAYLHKLTNDIKTFTSILNDLNKTSSVRIRNFYKKILIELIGDSEKSIQSIQSLILDNESNNTPSIKKIHLY